MILLTVMITAWDHNDFVLLTVDPRQVSSKIEGRNKKSKAGLYPLGLQAEFSYRADVAVCLCMKNIYFSWKSIKYFLKSAHLIINHIIQICFYIFIYIYIFFKYVNIFLFCFYFSSYLQYNCGKKIIISANN